VALSVDAKQQGRYQRVDTLELEPMKPVTVYLEGVAFALLLIKQVFTNEDGSTGIQYLVTSDTTLDGLPQSIENDGTCNPITSRSNRMLRCRSHPRKR
jgi:hypothetical protein